MAEALAAAHRRGIVHRDVKPRNILIDGDGRPRLTDFGSARVEGQEALTETGGLVGTLDYAAPEVVLGRRGDARADVYALGVTLHLALTGALVVFALGSALVLFANYVELRLHEMGRRFDDDDGDEAGD